MKTENVPPRSAQPPFFRSVPVPLTVVVEPVKSWIRPLTVSVWLVGTVRLPPRS